MKELKACIFDMDGVVVDNKDFHIEAWIFFSKQLGFEVSYNEVKSCFGSTNEGFLRNLFKLELSDEEMKRMGEKKEMIYRELYEKKVVPLKGLKSFLIMLREAGIKIGLATSAPTSNVGFTLEKTGLREYFDTIVDASMISNGKPDPEIFLKAAKNLNVEPASAVVFEDSFHGINAAKAAGMKVVGLATTHDASEIQGTDLVINDFSTIYLEELKTLFNHTK